MLICYDCLQVYVEPLTHDDLLFITKSMYPKIDGTVLEKMITFNSQVNFSTQIGIVFCGYSDE